MLLLLKYMPGIRVIFSFDLSNSNTDKALLQKSGGMCLLHSFLIMSAAQRLLRK